MATLPVPDQMTAVVLDSYVGADALRIERRPVPKPGKGEVLVKVEASPINPSDLAFLAGRYGSPPPLPTVPGLEGSGTVVASGGGLMGRYLLGRRVACLRDGGKDGVWAEYCVTAAKGRALPLDQAVDYEQGAMSVVNPLSACAFVEIAKKGGRNAIAQTAAASALGQMVNRLGQGAGIEDINVVRRDAQVDLLKGQGANHVLNSNAEDFQEGLKQTCRRHQARLAFDAVAGPLTGIVLGAMPPHSKVIVYGGLSFEPAQARPDHLIFGGKSVGGFWLGPWLAGKNPIELLLMWRRAQKLMASDLRSEIRARYPLQEAKKALEEYQNQMTGGKILLKPRS